MKYFLHLLDAHNAGQEAGVDEYTFRSIFYVCHDCGRYMTKRMASSHHDTEFDDSDPEEYGMDPTGSTPQIQPIFALNLHHPAFYLRKLEEVEESDISDVINPHTYREKHLSG